MGSEEVQTLVLEIGDEDLVRIRAAGLRIVLARAVANEVPVVVWRSLDPFQINTVTWRQAWALYSATAALEPGNKVLMVARLSAAQSGYYYTFTAGAVFAGPYFDASIPAGTYGVQNAMPAASYPELTFGLALAAEINGAAADEMPASAVAVLATRREVLDPAPLVYVWLDSQLTSSAVLAGLGDNAVKVDYAATDAHTLIYDPDRGGFIPKPPAASASRLNDKRRIS